MICKVLSAWGLRSLGTCGPVNGTLAWPQVLLDLDHGPEAFPG